MIRFRAAAASELLADVEYYDQQREGRGRSFAEAVDTALTRIETAPHRYPVLYSADIRSAKVNGFPYRVVYIVVDDAIDVLAVAHAKRRPGYWQKR